MSNGLQKSVPMSDGLGKSFLMSIGLGKVFQCLMVCRVCSNV